MNIDLNEVFWKQILQAASESKWIPKDYMANDWVNDACEFLRRGKGIVVPTSEENYATHKTRFSDSSFYDEKCVNCGATDAGHDLELPCPYPDGPSRY